MKTNKLHAEINRILDPRTAWKGIKDFCDQNIEQLGDSLRINDDKNEGVLYVGGRQLIESDGDQLPSASVDIKNLDNEEGLSYALFNGRQKPVGPYQIISWESPLLRPAKTVAGIPTVKCDLVAYDAKNKQLVAVEVKLNPENDDTNLQHGLLQSMAYGYLLQHSLKTDSSGLRRQVQMCLKEWCDQEYEKPPEIKNVACALAAPKDYFRDSLEHHGEKADWLVRAIKAKDASFSEFWVLEFDDINSAKKVGSSKCLPKTNYKVTFFSDVKKLADYCLPESS